MSDQVAAARLQCSMGMEIMPTGLALQAEDHWRARCRGRMPSRADFDLAGFGPLRQNLVLIDIVGPTHRLRWREVGGAIGAHEGFDPTGRWVEDTLAPDEADRMRAFADLTICERRPTCHSGRWRDSRGHSHRLIRLLVPLCEAGSVVSTLLGLIDYAPDEIVPLRGAA